MRREKAPTKGKYNIHWWTRSSCLTACQRTKNTKGQSAICEGTEYKKIQDAFLEVMKKQKMQGVVFTDFVFF